MWTGQKMIVWGGQAAYSSSYIVGDLYEPPAYADGAAYNPRTRSWTRLPPAPLSPRYEVASVWDGHDFIVWGGQGGGAESNTYFADGASYDPMSHRWARLPPAPLSGREDATAIWDGSQVVIIGGYGSDDIGLVNGATFDPKTGKWHLLPKLPSAISTYHPTPRRAVSTMPASITAVWTGTEVFAWPEYEIRSQSTSEQMIGSAKQTLSWTPGSSRWVIRRSPPGGLPYGATAFWTGHTALFFGGSTCAPYAPCPPFMNVQSLPVWSYAPSTDRWRAFAGNIVLAGAGPFIWTGRAVAVINGGAQGRFGTNTMLQPGDAAVFDPSNGHWLDLPPYPYGAMYDAGAIWTGHSVIVWGGVYRVPSNGGVGGVLS